jgi:glycosyltransferase involved in cell wall biosynthesis
MAEMVSEYLPDVVIADLYRVSDALIFPSREEGFGIPMLEAGLVGLPIFCADIPPLHEIAGRYATYFSSDIDPFDLAKLITDKLQNNDIYQLRQRIRQHYTWVGVFRQKIEPLLDSH